MISLKEFFRKKSSKQNPAPDHPLIQILRKAIKDEWEADFRFHIDHHKNGKYAYPSCNLVYNDNITLEVLYINGHVIVRLTEYRKGENNVEIETFKNLPPDIEDGLKLAIEKVYPHKQTPDIFYQKVMDLPAPKTKASKTKRTNSV